ncbi:hypothetical protein FCH28_14480 [Streptomyces piniterrae]|uniref:Uncharacterized protein n=1 Tax=Streptomyces piniterrae TaxID=2571125 RepID=A0A4U0NJB7_9ACTN|nr:hypothetical protein [Streptomyces piniterrae]TJZ54347.1 hypothetical protein FCH28_14480 [Streptomyces piniterrae]
MTVPEQTAQNNGPRYTHSEATRLLCAGVYFDGTFRRRVIEQLVEHEERPIAPSLGIDALPVLAHALHARRRETGTGLVLLLIWVLFIGLGLAGVGCDQTVFPIPWFVAYALVGFVTYVVQGSTGTAFTLDRAVLKQATRGRLKAVLPVLPFVLMLVYWGTVGFSLFAGADVWAAVVFPLLMMLPVWEYQTHVRDLIRSELSREAFRAGPRKKLPDGEQFQRIGAAIDREQHARLTIYDPFRPFVGAGKPYKPWSVVMELKGGDTGGQPLTGREVIDLVKPRLEELRKSSVTSVDRLRSLEVDELVYLPVGLARDRFAQELDRTDRHLEAAVGEGGEGRRHFLRVRIGAWDEQIGISVLVRVHTQGGMLVLEVVPHVLNPLRPEFRSVDVIAQRTTDGALPRDLVRVLLTGPGSGIAAGLCLFRTVVSDLRVWLTMPRYALPDGPAASVRELGSVEEVSLFQEMDISRYVKTLQDRISSGVAKALHAKGYETGDFEQYVINVSEGGVFIGELSNSAVAVGEKSSAKQLKLEKAGKDGGGSTS